jgi:hypothetical protein
MLHWFATGWKKTHGKTMTKMGRHQEGLVIAAEYNRMEETSRRQRYLQGNY